MSLLDHINRNNHRASVSSEISVEYLLRGDTEFALDFAFRAQRYWCEAREYHETLRICSEATR